jgi:cobalt-zinc-cadmium efflux system outer membrane protein
MTNEAEASCMKNAKHLTAAAKQCGIEGRLKSASLMRLRFSCIILFFPLLATGGDLPRSFDGLTLSQAIGIAIERNHDIKLSTLAIRSAQAATVIANTAPNPTLSVQTSGINPKLGIGAGSLRNKTIDTTIRIDQVIERGGKRELRTKNASFLEQASRDDLNEARRQLRMIVSHAYYDLLAAQERLLNARETSALFDTTLNAARKRKKAGDIAGADVARLQVDALRAMNDARQAEADVVKARLALGQLMGIGAQADTIQAADQWPDVHQAALNNAVDRLIEQRPDVRAVAARVDAAVAARKLALASRTRDVSVGVQFDHYPSSDANTLGGGNSYGIGVQIPLFVRHYYDGEIRAAEAALDSARENLDKARDAARGEIYRSLHDVQSAADRVRRFQEELLFAAKKSSDAAEFAFNNGAIGVMDVLDARRTYRATQLDAVAAQTDYAKSLAAWHAAAMEESAK